MPKNKRLDLSPFFNLYEQLNNKPLPGEVRGFLNEFAKQAVEFQNWGRWDRRSGFDPLSYAEVLRHTEIHLTGPRTLYIGALPVFTERLAHALADFYQVGYESDATDVSSETVQTM